MAEQQDETSQRDANGEIKKIETFLDEEIKVDLLVEVYKSYLEDTHQMRAERQAVDNVRVTIVTLFLGAEAYVVSTLFTDPQGHSLSSLSLVSWIPVLTSALIGIVGYMFCNNWKKLTEDFKKNLNIKYTGLLEMEEKWDKLLEPIGADLFTREKKERAKAKAQHPNGRGVGRRNQDLQEFFQGVFIALVIGVLIPKASVVAFTIAQAHWHVLFLW